jgi:hypothetical protein
VTPSTPVAPGAAPARPEPTHPCARCGAPVGPGIGLCERCNPLGLKDSASSQVHGSVFIGIVGAIIGLALLARLAVAGLGPFPAAVDSVMPSGDGLAVSVTVTNEGSAAGQTTCRVVDPADRGISVSAFVLSPPIQPDQTLTFTSVVTEFGTEPRELAVTCRTP